MQHLALWFMCWENRSITFNTHTNFLYPLTHSQTYIWLKIFMVKIPLKQVNLIYPAFVPYGQCHLLIRNISKYFCALALLFKAPTPCPFPPCTVGANWFISALNGFGKPPTRRWAQRQDKVKASCQRSFELRFQWKKLS